MTATVETLPASPQNLTQKRIFHYWLPLAASWVLMSIEGPYLNGAMARLNEAERMIAAFGIAFAISLVIESPVISLLPTSTAQARSRQSYLTLRRFTIHLMIGTTVLHILFGFTPLFDLVVVNWMGIPETLIEPSRLGLQLMILWSGAIAWRRFMQGILIRHGQARFVGQGTIVRLVSATGTATALTLSGKLPGVAVAALSLEAGVLSEALFATFVARKTIAEKFGPDIPQPDIAPLSYQNLVKFHWPLAASNLIFLAARPLVSAALARGLYPEDDLAAWPVLSGLLFLTRAPAIALPEVVIALYDEQENDTPLRTFSARVGVGLVVFLGLISLTPLSNFYFGELIGLPPRLAEIAVTGARLSLLLPLIAAALSHLRGELTAANTTLPITLGMVAELVVMTAILAVGLFLQLPGIPVAVAAYTFGMGADTLTLYAAAQRKQKKEVNHLTV